MTADLIARAEAYLALAEKATPGEWKALPYSSIVGSPVVKADDYSTRIAGVNRSADDAAFIAASHEPPRSSAPFSPRAARGGRTSAQRRRIAKCFSGLCRN